MIITPTITEVHERRYQFALTPDQVQDAIIAACLKAAGLQSIPDGVEFTMRTGRGLDPVDLRFTVPADPAPFSAPIKARQDDAAQPPAASDQVSATVEPERDRAVLAHPAELVRASAKSTIKPARPMAWDKLSLSERSIVLHLESLPDTFSPTQDLNIAQCLTGGVKAPVVVSEMGLTQEEVIARWKAMWCSAVLEKSRAPTIDGQQRLLAALRYRVEVEG